MLELHVHVLSVWPLNTLYYAYFLNQRQMTPFVYDYHGITLLLAVTISTMDAHDEEVMVMQVSMVSIPEHD